MYSASAYLHIDPSRIFGNVHGRLPSFTGLDIPGYFYLIRAATVSTATQCFVPSTYAVRYPESAYAALPTLSDYLYTITTFRASGLQWALFLNGIFLDYFAPRSRLKSYLRPNTFVVDMKACKAAIPGDGHARVTFTYTFDVARYVVPMRDVEKWTEEESCAAGDTLAWRECVRLAGETRGRKFEVTCDSVESLGEGTITELPGHVATYEAFGKEGFLRFMAVFEGFTTDESVGCVEPVLNARFPGIRPMGVKEVLGQCWKGR